MAYDQFHKIDTTSQMIEVALRSTSTGQLLTGVAYSAVAAKYLREGAASQTTVSVVAGTQGTFVSGGWVETGIAGVYQFGIPNAALAAGAKAVTLVFSASGAIDVVKRVVLVVEDLRDVLVSSRPTAAEMIAAMDADPPAVNVTYWAGVAVAAADANGNVPVVLYPTQGAVTFGQVKILADVANQGALQVVNSNAYGVGQYSEGGFAGQHNNGGYAGQYNQGGNRGQYNAGSTPVVGAAQREIADALKLAPAAGTPAVGSVYDLLGDVALEATAQAILEDTGTTLPGLIAVGVGPGSGTGYYTDTIDDGTNPLDGVRVQLYTAPDRVGPAYEAYTNALGVFEMWPDPGTYYRWLDLAGFSFTQDVAVVVTEP